MPTPSTSQTPSPWHAGELRIQRSAGVVDRMEKVGRRVIRDHMIEQHRLFYPQLPFLVLGAVDAAGDVWATVRAGRPGFLDSSDPKRLRLAIDREFDDPAESGMDDGRAVGALGIELHTRRRNRLNGTIVRAAHDGFSVLVEEAFGNCDQYIQIRDCSFAADPGPAEPPAPRWLTQLDGAAADLVERSDTFFVASYVTDDNGRCRVDVSHRGGRAGFVRLGADGVLTIPDFAGNLFFNTLGNFLLNPRAGLVFVDFNTGGLLQMTGDASVVLESPEIAAFQGAERLWQFRPRRIVSRHGALPLRWKFSGGWSPNSLLTGDWRDAARRTDADRRGKEWRLFRIASVVDESSLVRSFVLEPVDGEGVVLHKAGQHLPIRVMLPGASTPIQRTYTLSSAPSDGCYRISVKRSGRVSTFLHELSVGSTIETLPPAGRFTIDAAERRPAVLLAGGIGITPLLAMLRHVVYEGQRTRRTRPTWLFYSAASKQERAFHAELVELAKASEGAIRLACFLTRPSEGASDDHDRAGRIDIHALTSILPLNDYDFYLCGPSAFMQSLYDGLRGLNVSDERIHAEAFGPSGLRRSTRPGDDGQRPKSSEKPVSVRFARSGKREIWRPTSGTLLDLAEAVGLQAVFQCRIGSCGTCRTRVLTGEIAYETEPSADVEEGYALICCAVPAAATDGDVALEL